MTVKKKIMEHTLEEEGDKTKAERNVCIELHFAFHIPFHEHELHSSDAFCL